MTRTKIAKLLYGTTLTLSVLRTKKAQWVYAVAMIALGMCLDASNSTGAQALHHVAFIMAGIAIGCGMRK